MKFFCHNTHPQPSLHKLDPPLDPIENCYKVKEILDSRLKCDKLEYKVQDTWEPITNVDDTTEAIKEFHRKYPSAPRPRPAWLWCFVYVENLTISAHVPKKLYNWENGISERIQYIQDRSKDTSTQIKDNDS